MCVLDDTPQLMLAFVSWSIEACILTIDHSLCWPLCHCLLRCVCVCVLDDTLQLMLAFVPLSVEVCVCVCVLDDTLQLMLAFVPLSVEVCVFDDPFKRQSILCVCF